MPMNVQTSFPAAPPTNASVSARPMTGSSAPLARSRNGSSVRNAIRVALSIMPIDNRIGNPACPARNTRVPDRSGLCAADVTSCGSDMNTAAAAAMPTAPSTTTLERHGSHSISSVAAAGNSIFPTSPEKL